MKNWGTINLTAWPLLARMPLELVVQVLVSSLRLGEILTGQQGIRGN